MDVTVRQLRMLNAVAHRGTIASAADVLGYTPSAVSQQLANLERATGVAILERVGRNVRLTDPGRELVRHATDVLARLEQAQVALEQSVRVVSGELRLSVFESVASTLLPDTLGRLAELHPDLVVRSVESDAEVAMNALVAGEIDAAFTIDYSHRPAPSVVGVDFVPIARDYLRLVVPAGEDVGSGAVDLARFAEREMIAPPVAVGCGVSIIAACQLAGFEPRVQHEIDNYPAALQMVAAGVGIAIIPDLGLVHRPPGVSVHELAQPVHRVVELAHRSSSADRPALTALIEAVRTAAAGHGLDTETSRV